MILVAPVLAGKIGAQARYRITDFGVRSIFAHVVLFYTYVPING